MKLIISIYLLLSWSFTFADEPFSYKCKSKDGFMVPSGDITTFYFSGTVLGDNLIQWYIEDMQIAHESNVLITDFINLNYRPKASFYDQQKVYDGVNKYTKETFSLSYDASLVDLKNKPGYFLKSIKVTLYDFSPKEGDVVMHLQTSRESEVVVEETIVNSIICESN